MMETGRRSEAALMTDTEMHKKIKLEKVNAAKAAEGEKQIEKPT